MKIKKIIKKAHKFARPFCITDGGKFRLKEIDPGETLEFKGEDHPRVKEALAVSIEALAEMQDKLYAQDKWAVLVLLQAMDAAGKDSTIKHVMSGVNPQSCQVSAFKAPSAEELDHDYLWRCTRCLPNRGHIGIFNRSYYEETLVVRVHPELLAKEKIPRSLITNRVWEERFQDIRCFERYLTRNGIVVLKFFLHVSKEEQRRRFLERVERPDKYWKFSIADMTEREHWNEYQNAYEDMIRNTASKHSPWYVVPADNKWFTRIIVSSAIIDTLGSLDLSYPKMDKTRLKEIESMRRALMKSK